MIKSFRHKGLKRLYEQDDARGINAQHAEKNFFNSNNT